MIGEDVGAEMQAEWEEERREEERRKLKLAREREARAHRQQMAQVRANVEEAQRQYEAHGRVIDPTLSDCFADRGTINIGGICARDVM